MTNSSFLRRIIFALFVLSTVFFVSCDDDFNLLGADVIGGDIHSDMVKDSAYVVAYDRPTGAVQSNNALQNQIGIYDNPIFGKTISHFVSQIALGTGATNPTLFEPVIDTVYLYVPYYSSITGVDDEDTGTSLYKLDTNYIKGATDVVFDLKVYRNGYFLRDSDPGATDNVQRYYSDDKAMVKNMVVGTPLAHDPEFFFDPKEQKRTIDPDGEGGNAPKVIERLAPGIFMNLDKAAMQEAIMSQAGRANLLNASIFENYFRGLYFEVTEKDKSAAMCTPNFSKGYITIKYTDNEANTDGTKGGTRITKTMTFNLTGNTINFFDNTYDNDLGFTSGITTSDGPAGDDNLYLKGGAGSMAIIDLDPDQITRLRNLYKDSDGNVLMNEANLVFHIDRNKTSGKGMVAPRIYLYDLKNRKPLIDYSMDGTKNLGNSKYDKYVFGGIIDTIRNKNGDIKDVEYRIRLTNHIKNIMKGDSTNVKLGLVVTDNISITTNYRLKTPFTDGDTEVKEIPYGSVQNLFGTVLYGSGTGPDVPEDKRVQLRIYYSKPKE